MSLQVVPIFTVGAILEQVDMRENENVDNFQEMFKKLYYFDPTFHLIFILQKVLKAEGLLGSCSSCEVNLSLSL